MPRTCFLIDSDDKDAQRTPGAMWSVDAYGPGGDYRERAERMLLSAEYLRDHADRAPLCVCLPDGTPFLVDMPFGGVPHGPGWSVTGEAPALTLSPSINIVGSYHGWLTGGVLSDDLAGRSWPATTTEDHGDD